MAPPKVAEPRRKYFTVDDANRTLPLVRMIVGDIVRQYDVVNSLQQRLAAVVPESKRPAGDPYFEELAQSRAELQEQEAALKTYVEELKQLGVELKSPDGLCDFRALRDGREVALCWHPGEEEVGHWHELNDPAHRHSLAVEPGRGRRR